MSQDEIAKLFQYLQEEFEKIHNRLDQVNVSFDENRKLVDERAQSTVSYTQEMLILARKVDRLERWINQIAAKTGVKLEY